MNKILQFFFTYFKEQRYNFENDYMNLISLNTELGLDLSPGHMTSHFLQNVESKIQSQFLSNTNFTKGSRSS